MSEDEKDKLDKPSVVDIQAARSARDKKAKARAKDSASAGQAPYIPKSWNIHYKGARWGGGDGSPVAPRSQGNAGFKGGAIGGGAPVRLFNFSAITPVTRFLLLACAIVFVLVRYGLPVEAQDFVLRVFAFSPAMISALMEGQVSFLVVLSPISYMFLHGGVVHLAFNALMLLAFGVLVERSFGARALLTLFFGGGLCGAAAFFVLNYGLDYPLIGASAGLSALFGAALLQMNPRTAEYARMRGKKPLSDRTMILIWLAILVVTGMMAQDVAWQAHVAGFLFGVAWHYWPRLRVFI